MCSVAYLHLSSKNATTSTKNTKQVSILYYFKSKSNKTDVCQLKSPLLCGKPLYGLSEDHLIERYCLYGVHIGNVCSHNVYMGGA